MTAMTIAASAARGGYQFNLNNSTVSDDQSGLAAASASFSVKRNGQVTFTGNLSSSNYYWVNPHNSTIGDSYYVDINVTGSAPTSGSGTSPVALTSDRSWTWALAAGGGSLTATVTVQIATDSGMTNVVASGTFTVSVTSHP